MARARKVAQRVARSESRVVSADGRREVGGGLGADGEAGMKASYYLLSGTTLYGYRSSSKSTLNPDGVRFQLASRERSTYQPAVSATVRVSQKKSRMVN